MNRTIIKAIPELNEQVLVPSNEIVIYESGFEPDCVSLYVTGGEYDLIQGGMRLSTEQVETLVINLIEHLGVESYDLGKREGHALGHEAGEREGYSEGHENGHADGYAAGEGEGYAAGVRAVEAAHGLEGAA